MRYCHWHGLRFAAIVILPFAIDLSGVAFAQTGDTRQELVEAYRAAYRELLEEPLDLDNLFRFAELAERVGEPRVAARALERVILTNPDLTPVRIRLAALHYRLGDYELARAHLLLAQEDTSVAPETSALIEDYLEATGDRTARQRVDGTFEVGVRYQTNANGAPSTDRLLFEGEEVDAGDAVEESDDEDVYASLNLRHSLDLGTTRVHSLENTATVFASKRLEQGEFDYLFARATTGVRFRTSATPVPEASVRPHLIASYIGIDDSTYSVGIGAGVDASKRFSRRLAGDLEIIGLYRFFNDTGRFPDNSEHEGVEVAGGLGLAYAFPTNTVVRLGVISARDAADDDDEANTQFGLNLRATQVYQAPWGVTERPWSSSLGVAWLYVRFDDDDPEIDPDTVREDHRFRVQFATRVPLHRRLSFVVRAGYEKDESNVRNFEQHNIDVGGGLALRF